VLLPTAVKRLEKRHHNASQAGLVTRLFPAPAPATAWWLSLLWLEDRLWVFGSLVIRLGARIGLGLARLEGRYYLPLALIMALMALLAIIR
jgi:hypothetical protein